MLGDFCMESFDGNGDKVCKCLVPAWTSGRIGGAGGGWVDWDWEMMPAVSYLSALSGDVGGSVLWEGSGDGVEY